MSSFSQEIKDNIRKYEKRINATAKESVQDTVRLAQTPRGRGGRMRVLTGFLRASIAAALGRMPSGESSNPDGTTYRVGDSIDGDSVAATLLRWNPSSGDPIYIGWTANYARPREYRDGFLRGAVEEWDTTVARVAKRVARSGL